ncbi:MAG TPA: ABC transporter permease subunit [Gammaproteobacteria bacterium]|jgi:NitT/TauT family transport system permease protein|nr:ABC transporter permease subunit [Gammaproteobacteria bacterium]
MRRLGLGVVGLALFLLAWQLIGHYRLAGLSWPSLVEVLAVLLDPDRRALFIRAFSATVVATAIGYCIGAALGLGAAMGSHLLPAARPGTDRLAAVLHSIPSIALAPVFIVFLSRESTPVAIAAAHAAFVIYVAASSGLAAASQGHGDLLTVLGASRWQRLWRLDMPAALPALSSGLKLAVPVSLIGAVIGEWFGAPRGLGVLIVNAMQNFQIPLLWSAVTLIAATSLTLYAALTLLERACYGRFT